VGGLGEPGASKLLVKISRNYSRKITGTDLTDVKIEIKSFQMADNP
jgi:hypothetical protein